MLTKLNEAVHVVKKEIRVRPRVGIILGSGLGGALQDISITTELAYQKIPHFPCTTVRGHEGKLLFGSYQDKHVVFLQGRPHFYEGFSMQDIAFTVRLLGHLGIQTLVLTAAVGGINPLYETGDIILLKDYINLMGDNPLSGAHVPASGERFIDMHNAFDASLSQRIKRRAQRQKIAAHFGTYVAVRGPVYETMAEIHAFRKLGGDVVGMSVVPEVITARQMGLQVVGICNIANVHEEHKAVSHDEVLEVGKQAEKRMNIMIKEALYCL